MALQRLATSTSAPAAERAVADAELIGRCLNNDSAAWEQILARYSRRVFNIAFKFTARHDQAEDLTQEIFLKLFKSLSRFNRDADFSTWLSSVARNYCIDNYRSRRRERELLAFDASALETAPDPRGNALRRLEDDDRRALLRRGLTQLPPKLREAVVLRDLHELTYQEMADRLNLPEGTVKSRINRGREELARLLLREQAGRPGRVSRRQ
jgi:RNA polymerase sigma-70 factor (ECF subfamily)